MVRKSVIAAAVLLFSWTVLFAQIENPAVGDNQVDSDLKFGLELFKNKMFDLAEEQFNKFLQQYPTSPSASQARYYLAMSQLDQKKYADAATSFQNFAVQYPNDPQAPSAWMNAGDSYVRTNDFAGAALSYERLQVFYPKDSRASGSLLTAAKYFELSGDTSRAEISLLAIEQDYPTSSSYFSATIQLGDLYVKSGQRTKAENQYKALLSSDNDSVRVMGLLALGRLDRLRGMSIQAGKFLDDAVQLDINPQSTDALLERIGLEIDAGNFSSAYERADRINADALTADQKENLTFEKAYAALAADDNETFKSISGRLKTLSPSHKLEMARLFKTKKRFSDGLSILRNFPRKDANEEALNLYAELAFKSHRMSLADSILGLSIDLTKTPDIRAIIMLLDIESQSLKDAERTRQTFYRFQNILKDRPDAYLYYTACFDENDGNYEEAINNFQELLRSYPESDYAPAADSISNYVSTFENTNYKNAVSGLADIVTAQAISPSSGTLLQLGDLFENDLKDYRKAERIFRQLVSVSTGDTQRVAEYFLADVLYKASLGKADENSEAYSVYEKLSLSLANDSLTENSMFMAIQIQVESGDSAAAGKNAGIFLKRFPNSSRDAEVECVMAETLYNSGNYNESIVQAELVQSGRTGMSAFQRAQLVIVRSQIALDSLDSAKSTLESFLTARPKRRYLLEGELLYITLLKKINLDPLDAYSTLLAELQPSSFKDEVQSELADYLYAAGKNDSAYSIFMAIGQDNLWQSPRSRDLYRMAYCKLKSGDLSAAKDIFSEVVTSSRNSSEVIDSYLRLGKIYEALGDKRMSASFFEKAGSNDINALVSAGETYFKLGDYDNAQQVYKKVQDATSIDSLRAFVAAMLIEIDYKTDEIKSADNAAAKFKKNFPGDDDEYLARFTVDKAEYLMREKKFEEAQKLLDDVRSDYKETSSYPNSLLDGARIMVEEGDLVKAQDKLNEVLKDFPQSPAAAVANFELGNIYFAQEKYQDAINVFRSIYYDSLADQSLMRDAMSRLISAYESAGQFDGALDVARKFIAKYPDDQSLMDMKIKVGVLYEELKYFDQALLNFQNLAREASHDYQAELHYYTGAIYDDKNDYASAILEFLKVPYLVSKSAVVDWAAQAYYMAGKCYEQMNKPNEAIAMYQKIVDKPDTDRNFVDGAQREINRVKSLLK